MAIESRLNHEWELNSWQLSLIKNELVLQLYIIIKSSMLLKSKRYLVVSKCSLDMVLETWINLPIFL